MKKRSLLKAGIFLSIFCYCNVANDSEKKRDSFVSEPETTQVSSRDTIVFSSFKEIDIYYTPQFDSILSERRRLIVNKNSQNHYNEHLIEQLDSSLFALQWKKNQSIINYLKNNHEKNIDLLPLYALINAEEVNTEELYDLFSLFPQVERESLQGKTVSKALSQRKNKEGLQSLSNSHIQHSFYEINENLFRLSFIQKEFILIEFWASWCLPCRVSNKHLLKWYKSLEKPNERLSIVTVSLDTSKDRWLNAVEKDSIKIFMNISDLEGWESSFIKSLRINSIPCRILIKNDGKVVAFNNSIESLNSLIGY